MAGASASLPRDLGFILGPALVGAVALSRAGSAFTGGLAASSLPAQVKGAAAAAVSEPVVSEPSLLG